MFSTFAFAESTGDEDNVVIDILSPIQQIIQNAKDNVANLNPDDVFPSSPYSAYQEEYFKYLVEQTKERLGVGSSYLSMGYGGGSAIAEVAMAELGKTDAGEGYKYSIKGGARAQAWCASFISWCGAQLGYDTEGIMTLTASSIGQWNHYARNPDKGTNYTVSDVTSGAVVPATGDFIVFSQGAVGTNPLAEYGIQSHVAMVYSCDGVNITTIEGNWSGKVSSRIIPLSSIGGIMSGSTQYVFGFSRPNYPNSLVSGISGAINFTSSGLRIDTDGGTDSGGSSTYQSSTSYKTADGVYYDCTTVNVVVNYALEDCFIGSSYPYCVGPHKYNNALGNCLAAVQEVDESGNPISEAYFAVVGDAGHQAGEVSLALAQNMGFTETSGSVGVSVEHKFIITYFPDCKLTLYANNEKTINEQINEQAANYINGGS